MPAFDFPASSESPFTAPNGVIYEWVPSGSSGYWAAVGNSSDIWSEPEGEAFINPSRSTKAVLVNTSDSSEVRNAKLRVASAGGETHYFGGNERGLQIVDSTMGGNEGDGTTFRKATVTGQWKFANNGGDKFHISETGMLTTPSYANLGTTDSNCINKLLGIIAGFDVGTSTASGEHDIGRMRYDTRNNTWAIATSRSSRFYINDTQNTSVNQFGVNGANIALHDGSRNEPSLVIRNSGNKAYFLLTNASTSLSYSWNSLRPYTLETTTGKHLWGTDGRFQGVCRVGDETIDTSTNSSSQNGHKIDPLGRMSLSYGSTTASDPMIRLNRKRTTSGRFIEFKVGGNYGAHIAASGSSSVKLYGFASFYRSGFDPRELVQPTALIDGASIVKQLNPIKEGFISSELREVVPEAVDGEEGQEQPVLVDPVVLIPYLTKALKEALERIEVLEAGASKTATRKRKS